MATRRATRVRAKTLVKVGLIGGNMTFAAPLHDISPFGLSVKTSREVPIGTIFRLGIKVGADYFRAAAVVRAKFPGGLGLEFIAMAPVDHQTVRRLYLRLQMAARAEEASLPSPK